MREGEMSVWSGKDVIVMEMNEGKKETLINYLDL